MQYSKVKPMWYMYNVYCTYGHLNDVEEAYPSSNLWKSLLTHGKASENNE